MYTVSHCSVVCNGKDWEQPSVHFRTSTSWNVIQLLKSSLCIGIGSSLGYINMLGKKKEGCKERVNIGIYIHISSKKIKYVIGVGRGVDESETFHCVS